MLHDLVNLYLPMIFGIAMVVVGMYFKSHIYMTIGENGINTPDAKTDIFKWMCAQAIGPRIMIRLGTADIIVTFLVGVLSLAFNYDTAKICTVSSVIGAGFLLAALAFINEKLGYFSPEWLYDDDKEKKEMWIKTFTDYAERKEYGKLIKFVEADMIQPD